MAQALGADSDVIRSGIAQGCQSRHIVQIMLFDEADRMDTRRDRAEVAQEVLEEYADRSE